MTGSVILSLFPGIDLLGKAFEEAGYCVVRGPDILWGGDIRYFHPPAGIFWGVIGGSPCQDFSGLRRSAPTGYGLEMLDEFRRVVVEAAPEWWLLENVARVPDLKIPEYNWQRLDINQGWFEAVRRLRHIQFGSRSGRTISVTPRSVTPNAEGCATGASDKRNWRDLARLQGLPPDFDLPAFTVEAKKQAIGNGVPLVLGFALSQAIKAAYCDRPAVDLCLCGCGRCVTGKASYYGAACRKRAQRRRDRVYKV